MTEQDKPDCPIYKLVEGKRVGISQRTPDRRYSLKITPDETYYLEFTDEEERQHDEEEAKWEAERPKREAEAKKRQEEERKFRESLRYENRVVAFLDVLGWRESIKKSCADDKLTQQLGIALASIQGTVGLIEWGQKNGGDTGWPGDPQITHFSDCILLSVVAGNYCHSQLLHYLKVIVKNLLMLGFFTRGGIAAGSLIHRGSLAYGPALIEAYQIEQNVAYYPRIVLASNLADVWGRGDKYFDRDGTFMGHDKLWRMDSDGNRFYDFLQPFITLPSTTINANHFKAELTPVRKLIEERLQEFQSNQRILCKYTWLSNYFNDVDWSPFLIPGGIRVMGSYHSLRGRVGIRRIPTGGEFNRCRVA